MKEETKKLIEQIVREKYEYKKSRAERGLDDNKPWLVINNHDMDILESCGDEVLCKWKTNYPGALIMYETICGMSFIVSDKVFMPTVVSIDDVEDYIWRNENE